MNKSTNQQQITKFTVKKLNLLLFLFVFLYVACSQKKGDTVFDYPENAPEKKIVEYHEGGVPKTVFYYKVDEDGKRTNEKIGEVEFYEDKKPYRGGGLKNDLRDGVWRAFHPDGKIQVEAFYIDGKEDGDYKIYRENGHLLQHGQYKDGICTGEWKFYDENGKVQKKIKVTDTTIMCVSCSKCQDLTLKGSIN